jgi:hypothetical protein
MSSSGGVPAQAHVGLHVVGGVWRRFADVVKVRVRGARHKTRYVRLSDIVAATMAEGARAGCLETYAADDARS